MNILLLITTKGCLGCNIAKDIILSALEDTSKIIDFKIQDVGNIDKSFITSNKIKDFPTLVFIESSFNKEKVLFKYTGTMPKAVINRWIDVYFA